MTKIVKKLKLAVLGLAVVSPMAMATVTFNANTGAGFIGRGDVITFVGKSALVMTPLVQYRRTTVYNVTCQKIWVTGEGTRGEKTHSLTHTSSDTLVVNAGVQVQARTTPGQSKALADNTDGTHITGYFLNGYSGGGTGLLSDTELLAKCAAASTPGEQPSGWTLTSKTVTTLPGGGLYFNGSMIPF